MSGRGYVGGGSIAGILGISPYHTALDVFLTITEKGDEISDKQRAFFDRRKALEPFATKCFEMKTGMIVHETNMRYSDKEWSWAKAEIDAETFNDGPKNIEVKTVNHSSAWMWGDPDMGEEPPMYVVAQVMWGLGITRRDGAYVHALMGLDDDRIYRVDPDATLIAEIRDRAAHFWTHHIEKRRMPQPSSLEDVLKLYGRDTGRAIEASGEVLAAMEARDRAVRKLKLHDTEKMDAELTIKKHMRDAATLTRNGIVIATWKANSRGIRVFNCK